MRHRWGLCCGCLSWRSVLVYRSEVVWLWDCSFCCSCSASSTCGILWHILILLQPQKRKLSATFCAPRYARCFEGNSHTHIERGSHACRQCDQILILYFESSDNFFWAKSIYMPRHLARLDSNVIGFSAFRFRLSLLRLVACKWDSTRLELSRWEIHKSVRITHTPHCAMIQKGLAGWLGARWAKSKAVQSFLGHMQSGRGTGNWLATGCKTFVSLLQNKPLGKYLSKGS